MKEGDKYNNLTAISFSHLKTMSPVFAKNKYRKLDGTISDKKYLVTKKRPIWIFECVCGKRKEMDAANIATGRVNSCGCLTNHKTLIKHGHTVGVSTGKGVTTRTYRTWNSMKQRCTDTNHVHYKNYGARGITVCEKWMDFSGFLGDMGERPEEKTLDRIDNEKGYYKENCRWATNKEQGRNKRNNTYIKIDGRDLLRCDVEEMENGEMILGRIDRGWDMEDIHNERNKNKPIKITEMRHNEKNLAEEKKKLMELFQRSSSVVATYLSSLDAREREIIEMRFGLKTGKRMTLERIGKIEGCTRERIRQIEFRSIEKMLDFYYDLSA